MDTLDGIKTVEARCFNLKPSMVGMRSQKLMSMISCVSLVFTYVVVVG